MVLSEKKTAEYITPATPTPSAAVKTTAPVKSAPLKKSSGGVPPTSSGIPEQECLIAPARGTFFFRSIFDKSSQY